MMQFLRLPTIFFFSDEEDPIITCPLDFYEVTDPGRPGAVVIWEVIAQDNSGLEPTIVCDAGGLQSGDEFPIGVTTVTCTATDAAGNEASCSFTITVNGELGLRMGNLP